MKASGSSSVADRSIAKSTQYESAKPAIEESPELDKGAALITVAVPQGDAKVTVNGHSTSSNGTVRQFMSRGLKDGYVYTYVVKVDYELKGKFITDSKEVKLRPGATERIVFETPAVEETPAAPADDVTTTEAAELTTVVKLHVPADAEVTLAGNKTKGSGEIRTFRTKHLKAGQKWAGYTVHVTAVINGQAVSRERTIDVIAGSTNELTFNFDDAIAKR